MNDTEGVPGDVDDRARALLAIYQVERQDQQTSGNQSRALVGTGLAYAAGVSALLSRVPSDGSSIEPLLLVAAPLPLVALMCFLVLGVGNVLQRARYLVALERELEPLLSTPSLTVPNGFRRSEYVFAPSSTPDAPHAGDGASASLRAVASYAIGVFTHGAMFAIEIGLVVYATQLAHGWEEIVGWVLYSAAIVTQVVGWSVALRPGTWDARARA